MKKQLLLSACVLFLLSVFSSCFRDHDVSIYVSDSEDVYRMKAKYRKNQTLAVQRFLDEEFRDDNIISFKNSSVDEEIILDDDTRFYINSRPGKLKIQIDKTENTEESYNKIKAVCEDIKVLLAEN
jgi:hypothetical protein